MKLLIGLGNPGVEYQWTRHNLGFMVLDFWAIREGLKWLEKPKWQALVAEGQLADEKLLLVKPQTFYNRSGEVVQQIAHFYKVGPEDIMVICDDFDLPFSEIRFRAAGGSGGNNGLASIIEHCGEQVKRLRLGTASEARQVMGDTDFVLGQLSEQEKAQLPELLPEVVTQIKTRLVS